MKNNKTNKNEMYKINNIKQIKNKQIRIKNK